MGLLARLVRGARSRAAAALISQGVVAGSSLVLQIVASRQLGGAGLGQFSLLLGLLITANAIQSGWIGDSLTVLDRFDPDLRRGLLASQLVALQAMALLCGFGASLVDGVDDATAVAFGGAAALWALEETGRRIMIARRSFWALCVNDAIYGIGALGALAVASALGHSVTLRLLVVSMAIGSVLSILAAVRQLPREEFSLPAPGRAALGRVASFGVWRAAQVGLRPGSQAAVRSIVVLFVGVAALGELEGARLIMAPLLTVASGAGVYLLPTYAAAVKDGRAFRPPVVPVMVALGGACLAYGVVAIALDDVLVPVLTDGGYDVSPWAIAAWTLFAAGFAAGIPVGNAVVARGDSSTAFRLRVVDAVVGVSAATLFAALSWTDAVPLGLALGSFVGAALLLRELRSSTQPARADSWVVVAA